VRRHWPDARLSVYGHIGDGNLHFNVLAPAGAAAEDFKARHGEAISALVHGAATALAGSFSAEHGVGKLKRDLLLASESPLSIELMQRLKQALDPAGLMNPGKLVG
jgi:FAD/FMN-containing dehydrogenase